MEKVPQTANQQSQSPLNDFIQGLLKERGSAKAVEIFNSLFSLTLYCSFSISLILLNKALMYTYQSKFSFITTFLQNFTGVVFILAAKMSGIVSFRSLDASVFKLWIVSVILFTLMVETSLLAMTSISVPVFTAIKTTATVLTAILEKYYFGTDFSLGIGASFVPMLIGGALAAFDDTKVLNLSGFFWATMNVISTSCYLLYMKYLLKKPNLQDLGQFGPTYYNYLFSLPICLAFAWYLDEFSEFTSSEMFEEFTGISIFMLMIVVGACMGFASVYCMKTNTVTTYSVAGALNKIPVTVLGAWIFNNYPSLISTIGIIFSLSGGVLYSIVKSMAAAAQKKPQESGAEQEKKIELQNIGQAVGQYTAVAQKEDLEIESKLETTHEQLAEQQVNELQAGASQRTEKEKSDKSE